MTGSPAPQRLGKFLLQGELGRGGMGVVYRAFDEALKRPVAIKVLTEGHSDAALARFRRELAVIARLRHPSIVAVHEATIFGTSPAIVMDLVSGVTLERALAPVVGASGGPATKLPLVRALEVVRDAARALHFAHEQGVIHRDVKPQNLMIDDTGRVVVVDFGLALIDTQQSRLTRTDATLGTPAYMPPEQVSSTGAPPDRRSDVYGLGATLHHVLTGDAPFAAKTGLELLAAVLTTEPVPAGSINPRAKGELETICSKCLEKDPDRRYESAAAVADELDRYLAGEPILARPLGRLERLLRTARRHRAVAALSLLLVFSLVVGAVWAVALSARARAERVAAVEEERARVLSEAGAELTRRLSLADASSSTTDDAALALALDAHEAGLRVVALAPDDAALRALACRAALTCAEVALRSGQWTLAAATAEKGRRLDVDETRASDLLARIEAARTQAARERLELVERCLAQARVGDFVRDPTLREDAVIALAGLRDPFVVARLAQALDEITHRGVLTTNDQEVAAFACDLLGRLGQREAALPALARYLEAEADQVRAARAGIALCRLGGPEAKSAVNAAVVRFGAHGGAFFLLTNRFRSRLPDDLRGDGKRGLYDRALERWARGDRDGALADCTAALELDPDYVDALGVRGAVRGERGDVAGALADLDRAIALDPKSSAAFQYRGTLKANQRDIDGAIADQQHAVELAPTKAHLWTSLALSRQIRGDLDGAIRDATKAIDLAPTSPLAWRVRGSAHAGKGAAQEARADLDRAIALDPGLASAWAERGAVRCRLRDFEGGLADLVRASELTPADPAVWRYRVDARVLMGDLDGALADATRGVEVAPRSGTSLFIRGLVHLRRNEQREGLDDLTRAIELEPNQPDHRLMRGNARRMAGDLEGAISDFDAVLALEPTRAAAWHERGLARAARGDEAGAIPDLERALELATGGLVAKVRAALDEVRAQR